MKEGGRAFGNPNGNAHMGSQAHGEDMGVLSSGEGDSDDDSIGSRDGQSD